MEIGDEVLTVAQAGIQLPFVLLIVNSYELTCTGAECARNSI